jgi:hypothetical protein
MPDQITHIKSGTVDSSKGEATSAREARLQSAFRPCPVRAVSGEGREWDRDGLLGTRVATETCGQVRVLKFRKTC